MTEQEDRRAGAKARAEFTASRLHAAVHWRDVGELVSGSRDFEEARAALTQPPFDFSDAATIDVLEMSLKMLTQSSRTEMASELEEIQSFLDDSSDG